jgi:hypothetical protein
MSSRDEQRAQAVNAENSEKAADNLHPTNWPFDAEGDPLVEIAFQAHELIGLPNYSNIVVGPAVIRTLVSANKPNPFSDKQLANIAGALNQVAQTLEEDVVAHQRGIALATLDPSAT